MVGERTWWCCRGKEKEGSGYYAAARFRDGRFEELMMAASIHVVPILDITDTLRKACT